MLRRYARCRGTAAKKKDALLIERTMPELEQWLAATQVLAAT
jgi:hypothetical protein